MSRPQPSTTTSSSASWPGFPPQIAKVRFSSTGWPRGAAPGRVRWTLEVGPQLVCLVRPVARGGPAGITRTDASTKLPRPGGEHQLGPRRRWRRVGMGKGKGKDHATTRQPSRRVAAAARPAEPALIRRGWARRRVAIAAPGRHSPRPRPLGEDRGHRIGTRGGVTDAVGPPARTAHEPRRPPHSASPRWSRGDQTPDQAGRGQRQNGWPSGSSSTRHRPSPGWKSGTVPPRFSQNATAWSTSST